ncbi:MAG TPA: hypothetical protein VEA63_14075 [Opitutus sp.]|nr:hypothetical protein [Opitutus sp.]
MKRFGYVFDPLCLAACALYALNRFWLHGHVGGAFFHGYFNDLLLIPAALPLALWLQRKLGLRADDARPRWREIGLHLAAWALMAEAVAPHLLAHVTGDWRDLVAYSAGALAAGCWWQGAATLG